MDFDPREFLVDHFMNERVEDQLYDITFGSEEWLQMDAGLLTREEGDRIMREKGAALRRSFEVGVILDDWYDMLRTKDDTVQLIKRLKKRGYGVFYLSNISWDVLEMLQQRKFWQLFDGGVASCEVKLTKPDLRIYHALLAKYGLSAAESIFIDDNTANASAAFDADITGIHFIYAGYRQTVYHIHRIRIIQSPDTAYPYGCIIISRLPRPGDNRYSGQKSLNRIRNVCYRTILQRLGIDSSDSSR